MSFHHFSLRNLFVINFTFENRSNKTDSNKCTLARRCATTFPDIVTYRLNQPRGGFSENLLCHIILEQKTEIFVLSSIYQHFAAQNLASLEN